MSAKVAMCMGQLPGRKRKAMWVEQEGVLKPLAYFVSEDAYEQFKGLIGGGGLVLALDFDDERVRIP